jgi:hypothetical protein
MYKLVGGYCPICKVKFFEECPTCHHVKPGKNHCQFKVEYNNHFEVNLAVCKDCFPKLTDDQIHELFAAQKQWTLDQGRLDPIAQNWQLTKIMRETVW